MMGFTVCTRIPFSIHGKTSGGENTQQLDGVMQRNYWYKFIFRMIH